MRRASFAPVADRDHPRCTDPIDFFVAAERLCPAPESMADELLPGVGVHLKVEFDPKAAVVFFEWRGAGGKARVLASATIRYDKAAGLGYYCLSAVLEWRGKTTRDLLALDASSIRAGVMRWRKLLPCAPDGISIEGRPAVDPEPWLDLARRIYSFFKPLRRILDRMAPLPPPRSPSTPWKLVIVAHEVSNYVGFIWSGQDGALRAQLEARVTSPTELTWSYSRDGQRAERIRSQSPQSVHSELARWLREFPVANHDAKPIWYRFGEARGEVVAHPEEPFGPTEDVLAYAADLVGRFIAHLRLRLSKLGSPGFPLEGLFPEGRAAMAGPEYRWLRADERKRREREELELRVQQRAEERRARERAAAPPKRPSRESAPPAVPRVETKAAPVNHVGVKVALPALPLAEVAACDLEGWLLRERAALWWISNQSDDLLCLPQCRIQRLEYQVRTALRVLGALRGRALLSDEVGLGKTIEAGLVLKELFTRGLARRALILTVPSLVDQWREELFDKFGLAAVTTNDALFREDPSAFWRIPAVVVASLHTLKQPAQLAVAREAAWDALVVDEAHHLRDRNSQAWQAVNALPRQFMLLLTATPVQNSIEELYHLVTLLQPGQLPTPQEFRRRFIDPKRPREPREPAELRRLLGQVMIRNTRANAGLNLPPRRAETVIVDPEPAEAAFRDEWERALRETLGRLSASQASLWGRLLLQAAGSSPAAWRSALEKFPAADAARAWSSRAPLEASWQRKCAFIPPLARLEGGCVVFTQFRATQTALDAALRASRVPVVSINGSTPAAERHPLTERFRREGGALLLTRSGTEGRNLQFCHRLVNFDLPWNPMEIEQRIGRLHRLGQRNPVEIYNLVQRGTLQEHLLAILQEKLNLFELVVGETALILGERFSSDEFAEEILRRWRSPDGSVAESLAALGEDLAASRESYAEVQRLDETLFAQDFESS